MLGTTTMMALKFIHFNTFSYVVNVSTLLCCNSVHTPLSTKFMVYSPPDRAKFSVPAHFTPLNDGAYRNDTDPSKGHMRKGKRMCLVSLAYARHLYLLRMPRSRGHRQPKYVIHPVVGSTSCHFWGCSSIRTAVETGGQAPVI